MPDQREELAPGLIREIVANGRIHIFTLTSMENRVVDTWVDACLAEMKRCSEEKRLVLVLQDLAHPGAQQTTYSRTRGYDATTAYPDVKGRIAYVLPDTLGAQRTRRFVEGQNELRQRAIFATREEALEWLLEMVEE